jgi:uncharacterized protein YqhQ
MRDKQGEQTNYGGRALRDGVVMVGPKALAVAVQLPTGSIASTVEPFTMPGRWARNVPIVRGIVAMVGNLLVAIRAMQLERQLTTSTGSRWKQQATIALPVVALTLAEQRAVRLLRTKLSKAATIPLEAICTIALPFLAFGIAARLPNVHRLLQYHGAEHMAVWAAEAGLPVTVENARTMSRVHPRCGTTFAFWVLLGSFIARKQIDRLEGRKRNIVELIVGPLVIGLTYEILRFAARYQHNQLVRIIFGLSWQTQQLTTAPPTSDQLAVACTALQAVMDYE